MNYQIGALIYEGKAKRLYEVVGHPDLLCLDYKNSLTAFNAQKKGSFEGKGRINQEISRVLFETLSKAGVRQHLVASLDANRTIVRKLQMIPLEVVVRNRIAGSLAKKFGLHEGADLPFPLVEYYYKKDELNDPEITPDQAIALGFVESHFDFRSLRDHALLINKVLSETFAAAGLVLADFKIELGLDSSGQLILADEISPDSCRLWDARTGEKLDKDRFRRDLGGVQEAYEEVLQRLHQSQKTE